MPSPPLRPQQGFRWRLFIATAILGTVALVSVVVAFTINGPNPVVEENLQHVSFDKYSRQLSIYRGSRLVLRGSLGVSLPDVRPRAYTDDNVYAVRWEDAATVNMTAQSESDKSAECVEVYWQSLRLDGTLEDCFDLGDSHWYGGAEVYNQTWPMESGGSQKMRPFISSNILRDQDAFGSVLQPIWLNSRGVAVIVDRSVPLHVGYNSGKSKGKLCLKSQHDAGAYPHWNNTRPVFFKYTLCTHNDVRSLYQYISSTFWNFSSEIPAARMMKWPMWSTAVRYKKDINQTKVLEFANEIVQNRFSFSNLEIDDKYSDYYGDFEFGLNKFPDARNMTRQLCKLGFNVTLWVYPFANVDSKAFRVGARHSYWVTANHHLNLVSWWNSPGDQAAAILDTTDPKATDWFITRLKEIQSKYSIDSFKFDGGEASYLPDYYTTNQTLQNPGDFSAFYATIAAKFLPLSEVRVGYFTQHLPLFVHVMGKNSKWGIDNGLHGLITSVLTLGIMGYPFVLPDLVGGGADDDMPSDELFIRWAQVSAFMPAMQFSLPPWDSKFKNPQLVTRLVRDAVQLHENISDFIIKLAQESAITGHPIVRPLWWISPNDTKASMINDQFVLGDHVVIAPVLSEGQKMRQIYLPEGSWRDGRDGTIYTGPKTFNYNVTLDSIPYFVCTNSKCDIFGKSEI